MNKLGTLKGKVSGKILIESLAVCQYFFCQTFVLCNMWHAKQLCYVLIDVVRQQYKESQAEFDRSEEDLKSLQSGVGQVSY